MINTWRCRNYNSIWYQLLFVLRHPIAFIRTFKEEMYAWPSLPNTLRKQWMKVYTRLPFQKACRWLGHELIYRVEDSKLLDTFECRTRGKVTKYYFADCHFGYIKFYEKTYIRDGKTVNVFMDCFVTTLVDEEQGKKNAEETKTEVRVLYKGWVFTKKKAIQLLKDIINQNKKVYTSHYTKYPASPEPYYMHIPEDLASVLKTGKFSIYDHDITDITLETIFYEAKDNILKLWAYTMYLLSCPNDFKAHYELSHIALTCQGYLFEKERIKNPMIDSFYANLVKEGKEVQAKQYMKQVKDDNKNLASDTIKQLNKQIAGLKDKYLNLPYDYYRC